MKQRFMLSVMISFFAFILFFIAGSAEGQQNEEVDAGNLVMAHANAWNMHSVDAIDDLFNEDGIYEDAAAGESWHGRNEIKNLIKSTLKAIPDFNVRITSWFSAKDKISCEWVMSGTQTGDFPDLPASGKSFSVRGSSVVLIEDGKIKHWTDYYDMYSFLRQLGALPGSEPEGNGGKDE